MNSIQQIISDFYDCTGISVLFFNEQRELVDWKGYVEPTADLFAEIELETELTELNMPTEVTVEQYVRYIVFPFDERPQIKGYFVIGPYQSSRINDEQIIFKPSHCWPYFEGLLQLIITRKLTESSEQNPHIAKSIQYINENYHLPITLGEASDRVNLNMCYFSALFKRITGVTFNQYLNKVRIERSKELLTNSRESIIDISLATGFNNHNYFSSTFKKLTGITPTAFRNDFHRQQQ